MLLVRACAVGMAAGGHACTTAQRAHAARCRNTHTHTPARLCTTPPTTTHRLQVQHTAADGWQPPRILPFGPLQLHPAAQVLHYGTCCFEGMKAYVGPDRKLRLFRCARVGRCVRVSRCVPLVVVVVGGGGSRAAARCVSCAAALLLLLLLLLPGSRSPARCALCCPLHTHPPAQRPHPRTPNALPPPPPPPQAGAQHGAAAALLAAPGAGGV
jgi:hypothetical protein